MSREGILNFNVGVLGHIDSGKTSLAMALSTVSSTACFDKNPQSKERGITLDLGFSSFSVDAPDHIKTTNPSIHTIQITLVDCPGHASLIRTIIGGAQIVDLVLLVIDINKGVQTQTAECLVIGQIVCDHMIVVLNKIDLIEESKRTATIEKMVKRLKKTLETTKFKDSPIIPVSAKDAQQDKNSVEMIRLVEVLRENCYNPNRKLEGPFVMAVDHCFAIKGQGSIITGTVLSGHVALNDMIEIPFLKISKKVKSIQMFKQPVTQASQGDRIGVCVTQFDASVLERGLVCTPGHLSHVFACIANVHRIPYFKSSVETLKKFHVTLGHVTVMAKVTFFESDCPEFSFNTNFQFLNELPEVGKNAKEDQNGKLENNGVGDTKIEDKYIFALIEFENPVVCGKESLLIASKLDFDIHTNSCRMAFYGKTIFIFTDSNYHKAGLINLKVYKHKQREGVIERVMDKNNVICAGFFKKETNFDIFLNLAVVLATGEEGRIEASFGQGGKVKVYIPDGLKQSTIDRFETKQKKSKKGDPQPSQDPPNQPKQKGDPQPSQDPPNQPKPDPVKVYLKFRKYIYDPTKKIHQKNI